MRYYISLVLMLTVIVCCSKKNTERTNFAEITVADEKFVFDSLKVVFDTSFQPVSCEFRFSDPASNSYVMWKTLSYSKWINGVYKYPGDRYTGRSVSYLYLQTYVNRIPNTYTLQNNSLTLTIDKSENGRMHGTFSGKVFCYTSNPYGAIVNITGEFELPYTYR